MEVFNAIMGRLQEFKIMTVMLKHAGAEFTQVGTNSRIS